MNQKNLEFLKDQVKYTGFGDTLENLLSEKMTASTPEFKINHEVKYGNDTLSATLNFKKSDQSDLYFFNSYKVNLQKEGTQEGLEQTFYINKSNNISLKEAYNLLEGRSVNKDLRNIDGDIYNAWLKMDFKQADSNGNFKLNHYHQNYGYDLEASLAKLPIKELLNSEDKESLLASLKKGNVQSVVFVSEGSEKKQFIEANPHFKTINVYDGSMKRVNNRESTSKQQKETADDTVTKKQNQKQDADSESAPVEQKKTAKKKRQARSI